MDNKTIALIIVVILIVIGGVYFFGIQNNSNSTLNTTNNSTNNSTQTNSNITNPNNTTNQNNTANIKISAKQAQQIAIDTTKDITGENDTAGTPSLFKWTANNQHTWVWKVPLTNTATGKTSSLDIDAITGKVILNE
jgi:LAS superfamily LD-carboxypeptidase LdcB